MPLETVGSSMAMLDKYITIEGLFTYVLFTQKLVETKDDESIQTRYTFMTNDPTNITTTKSPMGCFTEQYIDNDLFVVAAAIDEYNEG